MAIDKEVRVPENPGGTSGNGRKGRVAPEVVVPTTRVNIALPFSQIRVQDPSKELAELAAIVAEMAGIVTQLAHGGKARDLRTRSVALAERLRS